MEGKIVLGELFSTDPNNKLWNARGEEDRGAMSAQFLFGPHHHALTAHNFRLCAACCSKFMTGTQTAHNPNYKRLRFRPNNLTSKPNHGIQNMHHTPVHCFKIRR